MKYLLMGIVLFAYNYIIWGQNMAFPNSEEKSHVSGSNIMVIIILNIEQRKKKTAGSVVQVTIHVAINGLVEKNLI